MCNTRAFFDFDERKSKTNANHVTGILAIEITTLQGAMAFKQTVGFYFIASPHFAEAARIVCSNEGHSLLCR